MATAGSNGPLGVFALAAVLVLLGIHHLVWLHRYRSGLPLDIDEAGYLSFALDDLEGWRDGGLTGLHEAVVDQRQFAPLVPLVATPVLAFAGDRPIAAMGAQLVFLAVLGFATLGLGRAVAGGRAGLLAAAATVLTPGVLDLTRTFHFALAATALLCLAVWALVRSEGLSQRWWSVAAGVAAGGMLLARTMTVALLPGLAVAAAVQIAAAQRGTRRVRVINLTLAAVTGVLVAGWWYFPNLPVVWRYLVDGGYGAQSALYGHSGAGVLTVRFWTLRVADLINQGLFFPVSAIVAGTFVILLVTMVMSRDSRADRTVAGPGRGRRRWYSILAPLATPTGTVTVVVVLSYLALTSSQIGGVGFLLPLVPLVIVLWAKALTSVPSVGIRRALAGALVVVVLAGFVSKATPDGPLAGPHCVRVPALDCVLAFDARGRIHSYAHIPGESVAAARRGPAGHWLSAAADTAEWAIDFAGAHGVGPVMFFASGDPLFNTNTVGLGGRLRRDQVIPMGQLRRDWGSGDTVSNYRRLLDDPRYGWPNLLVTTAPGPDEFRPPVDQAKAEQAARSLGFELVLEFELPDGRLARVFWLERGPVLS